MFFFRGGGGSCPRGNPPHISCWHAGDEVFGCKLRQFSGSRFSSKFLKNDPPFFFGGWQSWIFQISVSLKEMNLMLCQVSPACLFWHWKLGKLRTGCANIPLNLLDPCFMDLKKIPVLKKTLELRNSFFLSFTQSLQERSLVATTVQPFCGDAAWNLNHSWSSLTMIIYGIIFRACSSRFAISIFKNSGVNPGNTGTPWLSHGVPDIKTTKAHVVKLQIFCQPSSTGWAGLLAIDDLSMQVVGWKKLLTDKGISSSIFAS